MISIVIPIYNEEKILSENSAEFHKLSQQGELIFVDGGSTDRSVEISTCYGRVLASKKGRAAQMNYGASFVQADVLLFLHADAVISTGTVESIERKIKYSGFIGGCLTQRIAKGGVIYRFIEKFGNIRAEITKVFYGDQGIFVRKDIFFKMGGFPEVSMMEDVLFTKKLRRLGKTVVLPDRVAVSPRRWENQGVIKTVFLYLFLNILFCLRVPLDEIKLFYDDLR